MAVSFSRLILFKLFRRFDQGDHKPVKAVLDLPPLAVGPILALLGSGVCQDCEANIPARDKVRAKTFHPSPPLRESLAFGFGRLGDDLLGLFIEANLEYRFAHSLCHLTALTANPIFPQI